MTSSTTTETAREQWALDTCDETIPDSPTPTPSSESSKSSDTVRLYLSGLARQTTKATLEEHFAKYNPKDIVVKDRGDAIAFKFAFLSVDAAAAATIMEESPHDIDGTTCRVEQTRVALRSGKSRDKQQASTKSTVSEADNHANAIRKLFLGGLSASTTADDLRVRPSPIDPSPCALRPLASFSSALHPSSSQLAPRLLSEAGAACCGAWNADPLRPTIRLGHSRMHESEN